MRKALIGLAMTLAVSSCDLFHITWLEIQAGKRSAAQAIEWPRNSGETIMVQDHLWDSAGLAGIEVDVRLPGATPVILTSSDFNVAAYNYAPPIEVPDRGTASVFVKLYQAGVLVAEGHMSWQLERNIERWRVEVERSPHPADTRYDEDDMMARCVYHYCRQVVRIEIDEAARNYPAETLWLVLYERYIG